MGDLLLEHPIFVRKALVLGDEEGDELVDMLDGVGGGGDGGVEGRKEEEGGGRLRIHIE